MYQHQSARQTGLFSKAFAIGEEVQFPKGPGTRDRVGTGRIIAEAVTAPGQWFVREDAAGHRVYGPFYPDQLLTV